MRSTHAGLVLPFVLIAALAPRSSRAQHAGQPPADTLDRNVTNAVNTEMSGMGGMSTSHDVHMYMTALRPSSAADSMRAAHLVAEMRTALAKYKDVKVAEADGYQEFLPNVPQHIYHFTSWRRAVGEVFRFDPANPTSLLYSRAPDGTFTLVGAMYTLPRNASEADLDKRIPLSVAQWHQHVNWCIPPQGQTARWQEQRDGRPVFGPMSPIATQSACDAVGGRFIPHLFGWMVHANVFASDDPHAIWSHMD